MTKNRVIIEYRLDCGTVATCRYDDGVVWLSDHMVRVRNAERTSAVWLPVSSIIAISEVRYEAD